MSQGNGGNSPKEKDSGGLLHRLFRRGEPRRLGRARRRRAFRLLGKTLIPPREAGRVASEASRVGSFV